MGSLELEHFVNLMEFMAIIMGFMGNKGFHGIYQSNWV
jgi:hypothetical protein